MSHIGGHVHGEARLIGILFVLDIDDHMVFDIDNHITDKQVMPSSVLDFVCF